MWREYAGESIRTTRKLDQVKLRVFCTGCELRCQLVLDPGFKRLYCRFGKENHLLATQRHVFAGQLLFYFDLVASIDKRRFFAFDGEAIAMERRQDPHARPAQKRSFKCDLFVTSLQRTLETLTETTVSRGYRSSCSVA